MNYWSKVFECSIPWRGGRCLASFYFTIIPILVKKTITDVDYGIVEETESILVNGGCRVEGEQTIHLY